MTLDDRSTFRELRLALGLTQEAAAERLGISKQAMNSWEAGRTRPGAELYPRIAEMLSITPVEAVRLFHSPEPSPV